jgi:hypothetical protein
MGDGPCEGENPAIKETGQAWACLAQSAIEMQQPGATTDWLLSYGATAP